ncbi:transport and Golgi organization protein 11-like [Amphibalanus amphitrite]|nr:transport and Golgi organization protein 11-like [Amphibalanus amphitrite]
MPVTSSEAAMSDAGGRERPLSAAFEEDAAFAAEISAAMRVPKRIHVTGEGDDDFTSGARNGGTNGSSASALGARMMTVPDRIVVLGGERHGAGGGPPRELVLERASQPPAGRDWAVESPPRVLRVDEHLRPPEEPPTPVGDDEGTPERRGFGRGAGDRSVVLRDQFSPPAPPGFLSASEELELLRRQLLKVNRRLMQIEVENQRRRSREVMLYTAGAAYFLIKVMLWMGRM